MPSIPLSPAASNRIVRREIVREHLFVHAHGVLRLVDDAAAARLGVLLAARLVGELLAGRLLAVWDALTETTN